MKRLLICLLLVGLVGCGKSEQAQEQPSSETSQLTDNQGNEETDLIERITLAVDDIVGSQDLDGDGVLTTRELLPASRLQFNLLIGAKGDPKQLYINTFNNLSTPVENIPYSVFLDFLRKDDPASPIERDKDGKFSHFVDCAVPVGLCTCQTLEGGGRYVFATTPQFFETLGSVDNDDDSHIQFKFSKGRSFVTRSDKHGYFEAVVGASVAEATGFEIGDKLTLGHGNEHDQQFVIVGILQPTGSSFDRRVYVNLEGFYQMADHVKPLDASDVSADEPEVSGNLLDRRKPLPLEQREVTVILVRTNNNPSYSLILFNSINEGTTAQAVFPLLLEHRFTDTPVDIFQLSAWLAARGDGISAEELRKKIVQLLTPAKNEAK
jgi:hypothetical protein